MPEKTQVLKGKVAIVTGANNNIGGEAAKLLGTMGASVVVHYHSAGSKKGAEEVVKAIEASGSNAKSISGDLSEVQNIISLYDFAEKSFGGVDIVVNTVGVMLKKPAVDVTEEDFDRMFKIQARAPFFLFKEAAKRLRDNGRIIQISSSTTVAVMTGYYHVYAGAKAATEQFTKMIGREVGERGITVNSILPGALNTSFFYPVEDERSVAWATSMGIGSRLGEVSDVVPVIGFLASPEAGWVTCQSIRVNGGY